MLNRKSKIGHIYLLPYLGSVYYRATKYKGINVENQIYKKYFNQIVNPDKKFYYHIG